MNLICEESNTSDKNLSPFLTGALLLANIALIFSLFDFSSVPSVVKSICISPMPSMAENMITRIDHIGIVVQSINDALKFFESALGMKLDRQETPEGENALVAFLPVGGSDVELVEPIGTESGLSKFMEKRGEGIHHICFEVDDIDAALARLKAHGAQLINETSRTNARGQRYAFVHPKSAHGVLVELYERQK